MSFFTIPLIINVAKWQLQRVFPASAVSIEKCHFNPKGSLAFSNIHIKREDAYDCIIKEVSIHYKIPQVFIGFIDNVRIDNPLLYVNLRKATAGKLSEMVNISKRSIFSIREADLSDMQVKLATRDLDLDGRISLRFSQKEKDLQYVDAFFNTLKIHAVLFEEVRIKENPSLDIVADLSVKKIVYDKAVIRDLTGALYRDGAVLSFDSLIAQLFNGDIRGDIKVALDRKSDFSIDLNCADLSLDTFVKDFKLDDRFQLTGRLSGNVSLSGRGFNLDDIRGTLKTDPGGGLLVIKDTGFLKKIASRSGQSLDMVVENFKNYVYTIGIVEVSLDKGDIILDIEMEGASGKRTFNIVLHDIALIKRGTL